MMRVKIFDSLPSTHNWLKKNRDFPSDTLVFAEHQPQGRGQRGNSWESEPYSNLTFSFRYSPDGVPPRSQFSISEALAMAVVDTLGFFGISASVKWPNDIYVGDSKICGILIDHSLCNADRIDSTVASAGLNVNQLAFLGDAPNPTSMAMVCNRDFNISEVRNVLNENISLRMPQASTPEGRANLHREFMDSLWRGDGKFYPFRITRSGEVKLASIVEVDPAGPITLRFDDGSSEVFYFKEISFQL